jgi:hypothetical protein
MFKDNIILKRILQKYGGKRGLYLSAKILLSGELLNVFGFNRSGEFLDEISYCELLKTDIKLLDQ